MVNTIAPNAGTAMTATVMPPEIVEMLKPDYVAPLVAFLAHNDVPESGAIYETGSCWISKVRWQRSKGMGLSVKGEITPEQVRDNFERICDFTEHNYPSSLGESVQLMFEGFQASAEGNDSAGDGENLVGNIAAAKKYRSEEITFDYTEKDVILYALGLGARRTDLDLIYENSDSFFTLPTFAVIPGFSVPTDYNQFIPEYNPMKLLHGEQYMKLHGAILTSGSMRLQGRIIDIIDKKNSTIVVLGVDIKDSQGSPLAECQSTIFIRGIGDFNGPSKGQDRGAATALNEPPEGKQPDAVEEVQTSQDQAALYRLSGDLNPLHIDPDMSKMGGFDIPILHGLCFYGIAAKAILARFGANQPDAIKSVKARFASHVIPGDKLQIPMWVDPSNPCKVIFQVKVPSRSPPSLAISNAAVEFHNPVKLSSSKRGERESKL